MKHSILNHRSMRGNTIAIVIGLVVLLVAIGAFLVSTFVIKPGKGTLSQVALDVPQPNADMTAQIPPEAISKIGFTLSVPQSKVQQAASNAIPRTMASGGPVKHEITEFLQDEWIDYNFQRGNVSLSFNGNVVHFSVPIQGQVSAGGLVSMGPIQREIQKTVDIAGNIVGDIQLAIAKDFSLKATPKFHFDCQQAQMAFGPFAPVSLCAPLSRVFDDKVPPIAQSAINDAVKKLQLRQKVEKAWSQMFVTKQAAESPPTWVEIVPVKLVMKPLNLSSDPLLLSFAVDAKTFVIVQGKPPVVSPTPLPNLTFDPGLNNDVTVNLPVAAPVDSLSERLNSELTNRQIPVGDGGTVTVKSAKLGTKGDKIICALDITASAPKLNANTSGTVYLAGTIHYDPSTSVLTINNIDWDTQTKDALVQNSAWILHDSVLNAVRDKAKFDAAPLIASATKQANVILKDKLAGMKGPVSLNVNVDSIKLDQIKVQNNQAYAFFTAKGSASGSLQ